MEKFSTDNLLPTKSVTIIGGGISGLTLGWFLSKNQIKVKILEKQKILGGLATSIVENGYMMDIGPHYVALPKKSYITSAIFELMGTENIIELPSNIFQKYYKTNFNGILYPGYPSLFRVVLDSKFKFKIKSIFSIIGAKIKNSRKLKFSTSKEYLISQYGTFLYDFWFKPYLHRKYLDVEPPLNDIMKQFPKPILSKIFLSLKKKSEGTQSNSDNADNDDTVICYFKGGMQSLIQKIISEISNNGGIIENEVNVESIKHNEDFKQIIYVKDSKQINHQSNAIVYCTPLDLTLQWFEQIPKDIQKNPPSGIHCILVFLMLDSPQLYDSWVVNFYDPKISFSRIAQQNFLSSTVVPNGKSLLSIEIRTKENNPIWNFDNELLIKRVISDLKLTKILNKEKVENSKILHLKNFYPDTKNKLDLISKDKKIHFVHSFSKEFTSVTESDSGAVTESDSGVLNAGGSGNKATSKITHGSGVYLSFYNSLKLSEEIMNELK